MVIKSTGRSFERKKVESIKQNTENTHLCPLCGERIEISRDSDTFQQFMKKWSNPY